jgi:hypothetical protein
MMNLKGRGRTLIDYYLGNYLEKMRKTTEDLSGNPVYLPRFE